MENRIPIERRINFTAPNTIGLTDQWDSQPVRHSVKEIPLYGAIVSVIVVVALFLISPFSTGLCFLAVVLCAFVNIWALVLKNHLSLKHWNNQLAYRKNNVDNVVEFFKEHGFAISEEDQELLKVTMKSGFKAMNGNGFQYRTSGLDLHEGQIEATFLLFDNEARKILACTEREDRITKLLESYEAEHGTFLSPELKEAFLAGVRKAVR